MVSNAPISSITSGNNFLLFIFILVVAMFVSGNLRAAVNIWTNICLVRYRELLGQHPFTASLLHYLGDAYQCLGDLKRAVAFKRESLEMRKYLLGMYSQIRGL